MSLLSQPSFSGMLSVSFATMQVCWIKYKMNKKTEEGEEYEEEEYEEEEN